MPFPQRLAKQGLGLRLSDDEVLRRTAALDAWFGALSSALKTAGVEALTAAGGFLRLDEARDPLEKSGALLPEKALPAPAAPAQAPPGNRSCVGGFFCENQRGLPRLVFVRYA